jgi:hypothetical protein
MIMMTDRVRIKKQGLIMHSLYPSVSHLQVCFDVREDAGPVIVTSPTLKITFGPTGGPRLVRRHRNCDELREY